MLPRLELLRKRLAELTHNCPEFGPACVPESTAKQLGLDEVIFPTLALLPKKAAEFGRACCARFSVLCALESVPDERSGGDVALPAPVLHRMKPADCGRLSGSGFEIRILARRDCSLESDKLSTSLFLRFLPSMLFKGFSNL